MEQSGRSRFPRNKLHIVMRDTSEGSCREARHQGNGNGWADSDARAVSMDSGQ